MPRAIARDGFGIHFAAGAREGGTPVLLMHPSRGTSRSWRELGWFAALESVGLRPIALDARGFGESDRVTRPEQLHPGTSTLDLLAVMDALKLESAHVCGFSMGAAAALRFAADEPARVRSLVLGGLAVGPLVQVGLHLSESADHAREQALAEMAAFLQRCSEAERPHFEIARNVLVDVQPSRVRGGHLGVPVLGVAGELDLYNPLRLCEVLQSDGAHISIEVISGLGHGTCFIDERFRNSALQFLAGSAAGSPR